MEKKRKPKTFLVKHKKTKRQQREFDSLSVTLRHLPESLSRMMITCPFCSTVFRPDWFTKHDLPIVPVKPKFERKGIPYTGPGRWIVKQVSQKCPKCTENVMVDLPVSKMRTKGFLFGDDAERTYEGKTVSVYSLVGSDRGLLPEIENGVKRLKEDLIPSIPAESWRIHMKDLWSGSNRGRHPIYNRLDIKAVAIFVGDLMALMRQSKPFVYNIAVVYEDRSKRDTSERKRIRDEAYIFLLMVAIDEWTTGNAQPNIIFDSEKASRANVTIHSWARDVFLGNQYSLLYGFLSKGIEIPEPKFVPPALSPGLELADFVSFAIGRYYLRKWQGKSIEIDPERIGLVTYLGYGPNGELLWKRQQGYPWDEFYEVKSKVKA
jgi:hypothetical protein